MPRVVCRAPPSGLGGGFGGTLRSNGRVLCDVNRIVACIGQVYLRTPSTMDGTHGISLSLSLSPTCPVGVVSTRIILIYPRVTTESIRCRKSRCLSNLVTYSRHRYLGTSPTMGNTTPLYFSFRVVVELGPPDCTTPDEERCWPRPASGIRSEEVGNSLSREDTMGFDRIMTHCENQSARHKTVQNQNQ